eukprot:5742249-Prymnesium_polylepis.1
MCDARSREHRGRQLHMPGATRIGAWSGATCMVWRYAHGLALRAWSGATRSRSWLALRAVL